MSNFRRYKIYYLASIIAVLLAIVGFTYAFFEGEIINNAEFKQNIVFESETYRLTTEGNAVLSANASGLDMFHKGEDKVVSETSTTINLTLENYDEEYRVCTYDVVWNWNENSDEYTISSGATKEYTIAANTKLVYTSPDGTEGGYFDSLFEETQIPNYNTNNNILYSDTVEGNGTIKKWLNVETKFYNLAEIDQSNHIGKNYSGYVTIENVKCNKTQYPKLSTNRYRDVIAMVSSQGVDTSSVTEIYFVDLNSSWPGSEADVAYFTAQDDGVIKAWTVANKLYVGQSGKVMPGPSMISAFEGRGSNTITKIDLSAIDTSEVTSMARMFDYAGETTSTFELNLGDNFDTAKVTDMFVMFQFCGKTDTDFTLDLGDKFYTSNVQDMTAMFNNMGKQSTKFQLDLGSKFDTSNVTTMKGMFQSSGYSSPDYTLNLGDKFDTKNVTNMQQMFNSTGRNAQNFTLKLGINFDTSNVTNMNQMFNYTGYGSNVFTLDLGDKFNTENVIDMSYMFQACGYNSTIMTLNLGSKFDTSNVTNMAYMFNNCRYLSELDVSRLDTSNVTDMSYMFGNCESLKFINVSNWDVSKVTTFVDMFYHCYALSSLDVSKWDTSSATHMGWMFSECESLTELDVSNFKTGKVTAMNAMFRGCKKITALDVSKWDTSKVTNMSQMFAETNNLVTLDLSGFNTSKVINMSQMFLSHDNLRTIYVSNLWNTSAVTDSTDMFTDSVKLVGGAGTVYDVNKVTAAYAKVDGGASSPGYFTLKTV